MMYGSGLAARQLRDQLGMTPHPQLRIAALAHRADRVHREAEAIRHILARQALHKGTHARGGQALGDVTSLAHPKRPPRTQPPVAKRRTHAAKRELPGRVARAFTLNLLARQFRARLLK